MKKSFISFSLLISFFYAGAQVPCGTTHAVDKALQTNPQGVLLQQQLETETENFVNPGLRATKVIPVVVHIIHNYGPENIDKSQVLNAISILNRDFQKLNDDTISVISAFKGRVGNPNFEFRLAKLDPDGNCTDGITRTVSELTFEADDNVKDLINWPTNKYFNIWVVDKISFEAGGYAYLPGTAPCNGCDGVVVLNTQFGNIGQSNGGNFSERTLTHEAGHWFNLNHTWGSSNDCGSSCNGSDNVNDTPKTNGSCLQCNLAQAECSGTLANVQNYMDYSTCTVMFTAGQATRMLAAANSNVGGRSNLSNPANLIATGTNDGFVATPCSPIADFLYTPTRTCVGNNVSFSDISFNADVDQSWAWNWTLDGATPSTSTEQNPTVVYNAPGTYSATLTATNATGSNSITKTQIIKILPAVGLLNAPLIEGIESVQFPVEPSNSLLNWEIPSSGTWQRTTGAAATGSASTLIRLGQLAATTKADLISPVINLSGVTQSPLNLTFKVAYRYNGTTGDVLKVFVSTNCGQTWQARYSKIGNALGTVTQGSGNFVPSSPADWRTETVNISTISGEEGALIRFEATAGGSGQNLYIDDINIGGATVGVNEQVSNGLNLNVFPNPITSQTNIAIGSTTNGTASLTLFDITGRSIAARNIQLQAGNATTLDFSTLAPNLPVGIYNLRMQVGNTIINRRLVVSQ
jgi:PKD repeat protein